jgi:hypothetical protein
MPWSLSFGAATVVFGTLGVFPLRHDALSITGVWTWISNDIRATAVAVMDAAALQGRVASSMIWSFISASNEIGAFEARRHGVVLGRVSAVSCSAAR